MKIYLNDAGEIQFLDGDHINRNSLNRKTLIVTPETELATRESLWVQFGDNRNFEDINANILEPIRLSEEEEGYKTLIPDAVVKKPGTWYITLAVRMYSTDGTTFSQQLTSDKVSFTVNDSYPMDDNGYISKGTLENAWQQIQNAVQDAEGSANESAQSASEAAKSAQEANESAEGAETAQGKAEEAQSAAEAAENGAKASETAAAGSANKAAASAASAGASAGTAEEWANEASESATSAAGSASAAAASASQANNSASAAANSANEAAASAASASGSVGTAEQWANKASESAASAMRNAFSAETSASLANDSASAAANNAKESAASAASASASAGTAEQWAIGASQSASTSAGSAAQAQQSAGAAAGSAQDAAASADRAQEIVDGIGSVYKPVGSIPFAQLPQTPTENERGYVYNITDNFTTDERFVEGVGEKYPAGSNIAVVLSGGDYKYDVLSGAVDLTGYAQINGTYPNMSVGNATNADNAETAATAGKVSHGLTITIDGVPTEYDGSGAKSVTINTSSSTDAEAVHFTEQTLNASQQTQARENIGAGVPRNLFYNGDFRLNTLGQSEYVDNGNTYIDTVDGWESGYGDHTLTVLERGIKIVTGAEQTNPTNFQQLLDKGVIPHPGKYTISFAVDNVDNVNQIFAAYTTAAGQTVYFVTSGYKADKENNIYSRTITVTEEDFNAIWQEGAKLNAFGIQNKIANSRELTIYAAKFEEGEKSTLLNGITDNATRALYAEKAGAAEKAAALSRTAELNTSGGKAVGWYKLGEITASALSGLVSGSNNYSAILLVNGNGYAGLNNAKPSGIIEIDGRIENGSFNANLYPQIKILAGNLDTQSFCVICDSEKQEIYYSFSNQYERTFFTVLSETYGNSVVNAFVFSGTYYGSAAPGGATYAINRIYAGFDANGNDIANTYAPKEYYLKTYTGISQLGLSFPCTTVDILNKMESNTFLLLNVEDRAQQVTDAPVSYGLLMIWKKAANRVEVTFQQALSTGHIQYEGIWTYASNAFTQIGWQAFAYQDGIYPSMTVGNATKATQDSAGNNIADTYAKQNGNYPNLTAGFAAGLSRYGYVSVGSSAEKIGWYKIGSASSVMSDHAITGDYSCLFLLNGISPAGVISNYSPSGIIELDGRVINNVWSTNSSEVKIKLLAGSIDANDLCVVREETELSLYYKTTATYEKQSFTILGENLSEGTIRNFTLLNNSYYGTEAPSGAIYAVNVNRAAYADTAARLSDYYEYNMRSSQLGWYKIAEITKEAITGTPDGSVVALHSTLLFEYDYAQSDIGGTTGKIASGIFELDARYQSGAFTQTQSGIRLMTGKIPTERFVTLFTESGDMEIYYNHVGDIAIFRLTRVSEFVENGDSNAIGFMQEYIGASIPAGTQKACVDNRAAQYDAEGNVISDTYATKKAVMLTGTPDLNDCVPEEVGEECTWYTNAASVTENTLNKPTGASGTFRLSAIRTWENAQNPSVQYRCIQMFQDTQSRVWVRAIDRGGSATADWKPWTEIPNAEGTYPNMTVGKATKAEQDGNGKNIAETYAPLASPVFTGTPQAPSPALTDNSLKLATTAWVKDYVKEWTTGSLTVYSSTGGGNATDATFSSTGKSITFYKLYIGTSNILWFGSFELKGDDYESARWYRVNFGKAVRAISVCDMKETRAGYTPGAIATYNGNYGYYGADENDTHGFGMIALTAQ